MFEIWRTIFDEYQICKVTRFGSTAGRLGVVGNSTSCFKSNSRSNGLAAGVLRGLGRCERQCLTRSAILTDTGRNNRHWISSLEFINECTQPDIHSVTCLVPTKSFFCWSISYQTTCYVDDPRLLPSIVVSRSEIHAGHFDNAILHRYNTNTHEGISFVFHNSLRLQGQGWSIETCDHQWTPRRLICFTQSQEALSSCLQFQTSCY